MITEDDDEREKKIYRTIAVDGKQFQIERDPGTGKNSLKVNDVDGTPSFKLDGAHARFFDGDWDVRIQWDIKAVMPQAIRQSKIMELFNASVGNPFVMKETNIRRAWKDVLMEYDMDPRTWMTDQGETIQDQMARAAWENEVMLQGVALDPTQGASEEHTLVHLQFTETDYYKAITVKEPGLALIFQRHILGENQNGPGGGAAGQGTPDATAGMNTTPATASMAPGLPPPNAPNAPNPGAPGGNTAAPDTANAAQPVANGGAVTNQMAPLR